MSDKPCLEGKIAVVFGGAGRIGKAAAEAFLSKGASVLLVDKIEQKLNAIFREFIPIYPGKCEILSLEIDSQEKAKKLGDFVRSKYGRADILLNAPAYISRAPFLDYPIEEMDKQWQANFRIVYMVSQEIARIMAEGRSGKIINIASIGGIKPEKGHAGHSAVKAALIALTKVMALELAEYNVQVNAIAPGPTETRPFSSNYYNEHPLELKNIEDRTPLGRIGSPQDHVGLLVFLASSQSDWTTGQIISSDGGLSLT
ncbi:MAG: SDR family NAD(P)-dependent oxidoreductase [Spirochaetales bacterium]